MQDIVLFPLFVGCIHVVNHMLDHPMLICRNFYKMDLGPKPGVSLRVAVLAEGTLTYLLNLVILYATSKFPSSILHTAWYRLLSAPAQQQPWRDAAGSLTISFSN